MNDLFKKKLLINNRVFSKRTTLLNDHALRKRTKNGK